jgi:hypothetical protein
MVYGRKIQAVPEQVRWIESFTVSQLGAPCVRDGRVPAAAGGRS